MDITKTLYVANRAAWRRWLRQHHKTAKEIWLVYYRKATGKPRISYNDAVEEALCYGWIDSIEKGIDDERFAQRFSPRKPTSVLSETNKQRIRKLARQRKMTTAGWAAVAHVYDRASALKPDRTTLVIPAALRQALTKNKSASANFKKLPLDYKRRRLSYIAAGRKHGKAEYTKRIRHFVTMTAQNKRFGHTEKTR